MGISPNRDMRYHKSRFNSHGRPKTFTTEEKANAYAKEKGITKYILENLHYPEAKVKKIKIVPQ
jgi:hypothetical protein